MNGELVVIDEMRLLICRDCMLENWNPAEDDTPLYMLTNRAISSADEEKMFSVLPHYLPGAYGRFSEKQLTIVRQFFGDIVMWASGQPRSYYAFGPFVNNWPY